MTAVLYDNISTKLNNQKPQQCVLLVLLLPVWYQGVITMEEVRVTLQAEPSRTEPNRPESDRLSSAQFYVRSVYTSSAILRAYSILSAPRRS